MRLIGAPPYVLLEDRTGRESGGRLFTRPIATVRCDAPESVAEALAVIQAGLDRGHHAAGFLAYEAGAGVDPSLALGPAAADGAPILWFGLFEGFDSLSRRRVGRDVRRFAAATARPRPALWA